MRMKSGLGKWNMQAMKKTCKVYLVKNKNMPKKITGNKFFPMQLTCCVRSVAGSIL